MEKATDLGLLLPPLDNLRESLISPLRTNLTFYYFYNMDTLTRCEKVEEKSLKFLSNVNTVVGHMKQERVQGESI